MNSNASQIEVSTTAIVYEPASQGSVGKRHIISNRGLREVILSKKIMGNLVGKLGRFKTRNDSYWMIISVGLGDSDKGVGHTSMVYETESDLEDDACSFTLQWFADVKVTIFTNDKRELKLVSCTLPVTAVKEWGTYIPERRSPAAVRLNDNILQLWVSM
jgi:hypothetical protein